MLKKICRSEGRRYKVKCSFLAALDYISEICKGYDACIDYV
jgi:hypothetical protein